VESGYLKDDKTGRMLTDCEPKDGTTKQCVELHSRNSRTQDIADGEFQLPVVIGDALAQKFIFDLASRAHFTEENVGTLCAVSRSLVREAIRLLRADGLIPGPARCWTRPCRGMLRWWMRSPPGQPEAAEPVAQQVMQRSRSIILEVIDQ